MRPGRLALLELTAVLGPDGALRLPPWLHFADHGDLSHGRVVASGATLVTDCRHGVVVRRDMQSAQAQAISERLKTITI
jgi:hypothetical protein